MKNSLLKVLLAGAVIFGSYGLYSCTQPNASASDEINGTPVNNPEHAGVPVKHFDSIIKSEKLTMVDFYTTWCGPCKMMAPSIEKIKKDKTGIVSVLKIDAEDQMEISSRYNLEGYPTVIFFKKGQVIATYIGLQSYEQLAAAVEKLK